MDKQLQIFNNDKFGEIRVIEMNNEPWFIGEDIVDRLKYDISKNSYSKYIKRYIDDEDYIVYNGKTQVQYRLGFNYKELGQRGGYLINESGLYSLILSSDLPSAKEFKRWITKDILPTIRKHGAYMTPDVIEATLTNPDYLIRLATTLKEEQERRKLAEQNLTYANNVIENIKEINITLEEFESKIKAIINRVAFNQKALHGNVWRDFYSYVNLKMGTNLKLRRTNAGGNGSVISYVRENERDEVLRIAKCWCVELGIDITDFDRLHIREDRKTSYSQEEMMKLFC